MKDLGLHTKIIEFLDKPENTITNHASFANYVTKLEEAKSLVLDQCGVEELKDDAGQRSILIQLWREATTLENMRVEMKAKGIGPDDVEDPLPDGEHAGDVQRFDKAYQWEPSLGELLCEPLYGRIKRESTRTHGCSVIPLDRVRSASEVSRTAVGKTLGSRPMY